MNELNQEKTLFPTQMVELPSKGLVYELESPLSKGMVDIKYMTAKEEDILTTESYIKTGVVLDKLLESLIVDSNIRQCYQDMLIGDKNALLIAARMYGYGEEYSMDVTTPSGEKTSITLNLADLKFKEIDERLYNNKNEFIFTTPFSKNVIKFKLMTISDDKKISEKLKKYKSAGARDVQLTERLKRLIISVDDNSDVNYINLFVEKMLAKDSRAFREYMNSIQPNVNMEIELVDEATGIPFRHPVTIGSSFFWPDL